MVKAPDRVTIFSYQVGFGDCFLLRFDYGGKFRHVLIDFGSTGMPKNGGKDRMKTIALDIAAKCGGKLDAVVATHRHADHISGFTTNKAKTAPGNIIHGLKPAVVLQPWTEQPDLKVDALGPKVGSKKQLHTQRQSFDAMHATAQRIVGMLGQGELKGLSPALAEQIKFIGDDNLKNDLAVKNLARMGKKQVYAYHGSNSGLGRVLPGIKVHVLGPPTLKQTDAIRKQRGKDPDEFWQFTLKRLGENQNRGGGRIELFPGRDAWSQGKLPLRVRWIADRLKVAQGEQLLGILRALDDQMNNTSLILLFEAGKKKLLFPGDAQIENWQHALNNETFRKLLADIDVYKVGHHGSLNATPRSLWADFKKRGPKETKGRLTSLLSTMPGKHGSVKSGTEVPRSTLVKALKSESNLHTTEKMKELCYEVTVELR